MKKVVIAIALLLVVVALTYGVVAALAAGNRDAIAERWRTLESDEAFAAKYPEVREKNEIAKALEAAGMSLGIAMMPRTEMSAIDEGAPEFGRYNTFRNNADEWISAAVGSPDDSIPAPPAEVVRYLGEHRTQVDAVLEILSRGDSPRWSVVNRGPASARPIPNLLGQMKLSRLMSAASLEAKLAGDDARAWRCQQAAWTLAKGTLSRPEMICQLIGVAIARSLAGISRKLDGPAPAWFHEMEAFDFHRAMLDSSRSEWNASVETLSGDTFLEDVRSSAQSENAHLLVVLEAVAVQPFIQWSVSEMERVTVDELLRIQKAEPCDIDGRAISASMESRVSPLARKLSGDVLPSAHIAYSRVANAVIAIEGTSKILALKAMRASSPDHSWPSSAEELSQSRCTRARWNYERHADGSIRFAFDGKLDVPPNAPRERIPLEYQSK